jgi:repressor LexA
VANDNEVSDLTETEPRVVLDSDMSEAEDLPNENDSAAESLTPRQQKVLSFIEDQIEAQGFAPTIREIGRHLGIASTNGVNDHLKALERKGYIERQDQKSRTLRVLRPTRPLSAKPKLGASVDLDSLIPIDGENDDLVEIPLLGRVAAGVPILAEENFEDTVKVSSFLLGRGASAHRVFALRVVGESMIEDGIHDGDFLFVKKQPSARAGEIVVAMIEGEATVKRFYPEGDRIRFQPANSRMEPIFVEKASFRQTDILGIVVGVYRKM